MLGIGTDGRYWLKVAIWTIEFGISSLRFAFDLSFQFWFCVLLRTLRQMSLNACGVELLATEG